MTLTVDAAVEALRDANAPLVDTGLLKPGGREEVLRKIRQYESLGLYPKVVIDDLGDSFDAYLTVWDRLGLDEKKNLLLIYNGRDWRGRGWGLDTGEIKKALSAVPRPRPHETNAHHLIAALDSLGAAQKAKAEAGTNLAPFILAPIGVVAVGGVLGLVIHRRNKVAKEGRAQVLEAKASAERAYAELILACDELGGGGGTQLQLRASELKKRFDAVVDDALKNPSKVDNVTLGKIRHFENEFATLRSTSMQYADTTAMPATPDATEGPSMKARN